MSPKNLDSHVMSELPLVKRGFMKGTVKCIVLVALTLGLNAQAALADPVDLGLLGAASAEALRNNGAQVEMTPKDGAYSVRIKMPSKLEHPFGSPKLDQFSLDKEVTFKLSENPDGTVHLSNIKGFKIHSVEKQMWVNLYGVDFGAPDAQGQHESVISAGKMGVVKQVPTSISSKTYEPIAGFVASIHGGASPTSLPVAGQPSSGPSQSTYNQVPATPPVVTPPVTAAGTVPPSQGWNEPNAQQNPYGTANGVPSYGGLAASGVTTGAPATYTPTQPTTVQPNFSQPPATFTPPQQTSTSVPAATSTPADSAPVYTPPAFTPPVYTAPAQSTSYPTQVDVPTTTRIFAAPADAGVSSSVQNPAPTGPAVNSYGNGNGNIGQSGGSSSNQGIFKEAVGRVKKVLDDDDDDDDDDDREEMRRKQERKLQQQQNRSNRRDDDDDDDDDD